MLDKRYFVGPHGHLCCILKERNASEYLVKDTTNRTFILESNIYRMCTPSDEESFYKELKPIKDGDLVWVIRDSSLETLGWSRLRSLQPLKINTFVKDGFPIYRDLSNREISSSCVFKDFRDLKAFYLTETQNNLANLNITPVEIQLFDTRRKTLCKIQINTDSISLSLKDTETFKELKTSYKKVLGKPVKASFIRYGHTFNFFSENVIFYDKNCIDLRCFTLTQPVKTMLNLLHHRNPYFE